MTMMMLMIMIMIMMMIMMMMMSVRRRVVSQMHKRDMGTRYIECFYDEDD